MRVGDLPMADRFAYAFGRWRFAAVGAVKEGVFGMAKRALPAPASAAGKQAPQKRTSGRLPMTYSGDFAVEPLGFCRGFDAQHDGEKLAAAPERVQCLRLVSRCGERAHETAIKRLGEVVGFQPSPINVDRARPVARVFELLAEAHQRAHEARSEGVAWLRDPWLFLGTEQSAGIGVEQTARSAGRRRVGRFALARALSSRACSVERPHVGPSKR